MRCCLTGGVWLAYTLFRCLADVGLQKAFILLKI